MNQLDKFSHVCRGTSAVDAELSAKNSLFREISRGEITTSGETQKENVSFLLSGRVKKKRKKKNGILERIGIVEGAMNG